MSNSLKFRNARVLTCVGVSSLLVLAVACGSSDAATESGGGGSDAGAGKALTIGFVASVKGEDATGQDGPYRAAMFAIDEINAAGGVNGQPIKTVRVSSPSDPTGLAAQLVKMGEANPDIIVGASPPTMAALSRQVDSMATPILGTTSYETINGMSAGSKWMFQLLAADASTVRSAAKYTVEELKAKQVAVLHTNESFGTKGSKDLATMIPEVGGKVVTDQAFGPTATDLTGPLLAVKSANAEAIVSWSYPGPQAVAVNALTSQGVTTPTVGNPSIASSVTNRVIKDPASFGNVYSVLPCNPEGDGAAAKKFVAGLKTKQSEAVNYSQSIYYDAVHIAAAAAKKVPSLDKNKLREALETIDYKDGACSSEYKSDKAHIMTHQVTVVGFSTNGDPVTKKTYSYDS